MDDSYIKYELKAIKAKEKVCILENELIDIRNKLSLDRRNIELIHELKRINIRMSKAVYELKHFQLFLENPSSIS
ncbi:hypothetical protein ACFQZF_09010 [Flavobacterium myungsuense]|uniref:Uncharacterized protein n=1 Tax=Flavobacterium myungsuense TaxID=651823 RepID=A0ABW3IZ88_9FLAO